MDAGKWYNLTISVSLGSLVAGLLAVVAKAAIELTISWVIEKMNKRESERIPPTATIDV